MSENREENSAKERYKLRRRGNQIIWRRRNRSETRITDVRVNDDEDDNEGGAEVVVCGSVLVVVMSCSGGDVVVFWR
jgi:hypothetical protein